MEQAQLLDAQMAATARWRGLPGVFSVGPMWTPTPHLFITCTEEGQGEVLDHNDQKAEFLGLPIEFDIC